ncbi:AraC family transcriptional regulator [Parasphingorhabdus cellanae]|uniref:AraC family transcriptional regulator n=1 Tax=Parasphingorhabdus cellanae TaxID=2806553 RepID=A0ABX7T4B1_9SPHN|nr:helix-turn-helix domain-containing protein [Parasphingorhabdus cellanae]QTD55627.1 AraC family transcriptional regulator [Parasphingorhabdus cellanae]
MALVDIILRLLTIGGQIMIIAVLIAGRIRTRLKIAAIGLLVSSMAYIINSSGFAPDAGIPDMVIDFISVSTTIWAWVFGHELFERPINKKILTGASLILFLLWASANLSADGRWLTFDAIRIVSLALIAHLLVIAIGGRADDLVEKRRLISTYLPLLIGLQVGGVLLFELLYGGHNILPAASAVNASFIFLLVLCAGSALLIAEPEVLVERGYSPARKYTATNLSPSETVLHDKLIAAMDEGQYRTPSLTIATLAAQLDAPEHRLRALINKQLGHRNFSSFLNGYRITEAKEKLSDRAMVDLPILTIAMDLGYGSLAPFNRAFRAETGLTPSDFRKSAIDQN